MSQGEGDRGGRVLDQATGHIKFDYLVFKRTSVLEIFTPVDRETMPDAVLSDDFETRAVQSAIEAGYRWVRTDGDFAIFERALIRAPRTPRKKGKADV